MRILISGGSTTQSRLDGLMKNDKSNGIEFIRVDNIEDIKYIYAKGDYFDRALIFQAAWCSGDDTEIKNKAREFALAASSRQKDDAEYIFIAKSDDKIELIFDELLQLSNKALLVCDKFKVQLLFELAKGGISKVPDQYIYRPEIELDVTETANNIIDDTEENEYKTAYVENIADDVFGDIIESMPNNGLIDNYDIENYNQEDEIDIYNEESTDEDIEEDIEKIPEEMDTTSNNEYDDTEDKSVDYNSIENIISDESTDTEEGSNSTYNIFDSIENIYDDTDQTEISEDTIDNNDYKEDVIEEVKSDNSIASSIDYLKIDEQDETRENETINIETESNTFIANTLNSQTDDFYKENSIDYTNNEISKRAVNTNAISNSQLKSTLDAFANRGNSIAITGCGGCGTSTIAYNLANTICSIGYSVLLVDMDTEGRTQAYISKDNYDCVNSDPDSSALKEALNSSSGIASKVAIIKPRFHLLTMGLSGDAIKLDKIIDKSKLTRFISLAKSAYNFVIYDIPFKDIISCADDIAYMADNIALVIHSSNWGVAKTMLSVCNIESEDMQETIFSKAQIIFNKYKGFDKILGTKVKSAINVTRVMDDMVEELIGEDPGYHFSDLHVCGVVNNDIDFEPSWFSTTQYSDTKKGELQFIELLKNIVLKS